MKALQFAVSLVLTNFLTQSEALGIGKMMQLKLVSVIAS
jgi:hypothetical protein